MSITIIYYSLISTLLFLKTTLLHAHSIPSISLTCNFLFHCKIPYYCNRPPKHVHSKPFNHFCDSCKILPWAIYFKETNIKIL